MNYIVGLMIVTLAFEAKSLDLPSNFKICPRHLSNFSECISIGATEAIISMAQGLPSLKIPTLEPLEFESVSVGDSNGAVTLQHTYENIKLHGLTKGLKIEYDPIDTELLVFRSNSFNEQVNFVADYTIRGQVLLLPISGRGRANVTMLGLESKNAMHCEKYEKDGETHLRVTKYEIEFTPKNMLFNFTNLFNNDPVIGEQVNKFLHANSELMFRETQGAFEKKFGLVFAKIANDFFSLIPVNKIFPE